MFYLSREHVCVTEAEGEKTCSFTMFPHTHLPAKHVAPVLSVGLPCGWDSQTGQQVCEAFGPQEAQTGGLRAVLEATFVRSGTYCQTRPWKQAQQTWT